MKMIDRIVERLEEHQEKWCRNKEYDDYENGQYNMIETTIDIIKEESKNNGWIPVRERLPEKKGRIFVHMEQR